MLLLSKYFSTIIQLTAPFISNILHLRAATEKKDYLFIY